MTTPAVQHAVDAAFREERGRVVATLILRTGDWDLAEGCAQEAFTGAQRRWPADGIRAVYRTRLSWTLPLSWAFTSYRHWPFHRCSSPVPT
jgi:predicted RNA polymerase sigma factor